jgi:hypothetical protein
MKPLRLAELQDLLQGVAFGGWWSEYRAADGRLREAVARAADLAGQVSLAAARAELVQQAAIETLAAVGAIEDDASRFSAASQEAENRSLDAVAAYEEQRQLASNLWLRLSGAERDVDDRRRRVDEARSRMTSGDRSGAHDARVDLEDEELRLNRAGRRELDLDEAYRRHGARKDELWREVERLWAESLELSLLVAERGVERQRRHREAEALFREAEERQVRARQLGKDRDAARADEAQARQARRAVLSDARQRFGCIAGERFLYFGRGEGEKSAWAVALEDDAGSYGAPVKALSVHAVERQHGVSRLEPAREAGAEAR